METLIQQPKTQPADVAHRPHNATSAEPAPSSSFDSPSEKGTGFVRCNDGVLRPTWAAASALVQRYYDEEWGQPITTEPKFLETLALLGFQTGLSWHLVLNKRAALREAFAQFDPDSVAAMSGEDVAQLVLNPSIIRNPRKLRAVRTNAQAIVDLRDHGGAIEVISRFAEDVPSPVATKYTAGSTALSKVLRSYGFTFVGPTVCYSLLCSCGLITPTSKGTKGSM